jgi:hypothetical protein
MDWDQHSCLSASGKATGHFYLFFSWKKQRPAEQTELDSATCITWTRSTALHQLEPNSSRVNRQSQQVSTTDHQPSRELHSSAKLVDKLHTPWTKLYTIDREHNSPLPGEGGVKWGSYLWEWGVQNTELNSLGLWVGHNTDLPYLVGWGGDLPEPKWQCSDTAAAWWNKKHIWPLWRIW